MSEALGGLEAAPQLEEPMDLADFLSLPDVEEGGIQVANEGLIFPETEAVEAAPPGLPLKNEPGIDKDAGGDPWVPSADPAPSTNPPAPVPPPAPAPAAPVVLAPKNAERLLAPGVIPSQPPPVPRPVRQSRLKRTFDVADLEGDDEDLDDEEEEKDAQRRHKQRPGSAVHHTQNRGPSGHVMKRSQSDLAGTTLLRDGSGGGSGSVALAVDPALLVPLDFPCPVDFPFPRKQRSARAVRPRSSRAAIARLKQAAHGTLPLGGSRSMALALLGGGPGDADPESDPEDAAYDSDDSRYKKSGGGGGTAAAATGVRHHQNHRDHRQQHRAAQQGPTEDQRQRMAEIAAAPPHLRQLMLQQLMRERLGQEPVPGGAGDASAGPQLASLSRAEQQAVVQQLMSEMNPQQRHTLLNMPTHQQAVVLQQYYAQNIAPKRAAAVAVRAAHPAVQAQGWGGGGQAASMMSHMGMAAAPAPAAPSLNMSGGMGMGNPELARQLSGLPREQQQAIVLQLLKRHHMQHQQQVQVQQLMAQAPPQQQPLQAQRPVAPLAQAPPPQQQKQQPQPASQQHQQHFLQFPSATAGLAGAGLLNQQAPAVANAMARPPSLGNILGGLGTSFGASNDPLMSDAGLAALLNPGGVGGNDNDALQDAMKFFLDGA